MDDSSNSGGADYDKYVDKIQQIKSLVTAIEFEVFADIPDKENIQVTSVINDNIQLKIYRMVWQEYQRL